MKKLFVTITILVASVVTYAQGTVVNKYFNQLAGDDKFTKVSISSKMFSLFTELEAGSEAEEEFLKAISKLKGLKIIASDSIGNAAKMYTQALKDVDAAGYDELMSVQDAEENMRFSIKESGGKIEELLMVVGGKKRFVLLSLYGEIDLKNISKIAKGMNVGGLENLSKIDAGN
ncbi:DUF4252 domain-containing protein [Marinoscillum pacificum]|uniref:DUF4252 domain-containing protein n=1 Tax=Marinoscillum pacificum TaxID=392723 RepID=UPI0021572101|nr:DUF4252 domain-containing protein [Marinoscillum pacificum]